ncbi:MAG: hypothetical protein ACRCZ0_12100 [Cetobacterium sp.]
MANLKDVRGTFDFTGVLNKSESKPNATAGKNGQFLFFLFDKEMESEVRLQVWEGAEGAYWDTAEKKTVKVTANIDSVMQQIKATGVGKPFEVVLTAGSKKIVHYNGDSLIADLKKLAPNKYTINVTGDVSYREAKGNIYPDYSIRTIEVGTKKPVGFRVKVPVVFAPMSVDLIKFGEGNVTVPYLVKAKLESGGYGYRANKIALNPKYFLDGGVVNLAKQKGLDCVDILNNQLMPSFINTMKGINGYVTAILNGRLKVGEITKKPSIDDINPMEATLLKIQGDDAVEAYLSKADLITEYFNSMFIHSFDALQGTMFEKIEASALNLIGDSASIENISNPMADALSAIAGLGAEEPIKPVVEKEKEVVVEATDDAIDKALAEEITKEEDKVEEVLDEDEFPF